MNAKLSFALLSVVVLGCSNAVDGPGAELETEVASTSADALTLALDTQEPREVEGCPGLWSHSSNPAALWSIGGSYLGSPLGALGTLTLSAPAQLPQNIMLTGTFSAIRPAEGARVGTYRAWPQNPANGSILALTTARSRTTSYVFAGYQRSFFGRIRALCLITFDDDGERVEPKAFVMTRVGL